MRDLIELIGMSGSFSRDAGKLWLKTQSSLFICLPLLSPLLPYLCIAAPHCSFFHSLQILSSPPFHIIEVTDERGKRVNGLKPVA